MSMSLKNTEFQCGWKLKSRNNISPSGRCCLWFFPWFSAHPFNHLPFCWLWTEWKSCPYGCFGLEIKWSSGIWVLPPAPLSVPSNALAPSHSSVTTAVSSGLAVSTSLTALPPFPFGNRCSSSIYMPPFSWIGMSFHKLGIPETAREEKEVGEGFFLVMARGDAVLQLQNLDECSITQQVN